MKLEDADPKGLIRESYRIEGITAGECRSILLDWALALPQGRDVTLALQVLANHYATLHLDHPMNAVLVAGMEQAAPARRRGGRAGRMG